MIDLYFFRATATVIPTLLIAVVFTGKIMDAWKLEVDDETSDLERRGKVAEYIGGITFVAWLLFASIVGEGAALAAIASGEPRFIYLVLVLVAICFQLVCLAGIVLLQAVARLEDHEAKKAMFGYILIGVGLVIFLVLIFSAIA